MHKYIFLIVLISLSTISCSNTNIDMAIIKIETDNIFSVNKVKVTSNSKTIVPEINNTELIFSIKLSKSKYFQLSIENFSINLFLAGGNRINISSGLCKLKKNSFSGKGSLINNYLLDDKHLTDNITNNTDFNYIYSLSPSEFSQRINLILNKRKKRFENFISVNNIENELFISTERKRIFYWSATQKNLYYRDHKFLTGKKSVLNNKFNSYFEEMDLNDSTIMHMEIYRDFLYTYFENKAIQQKDIYKSGKQDDLITELAFNYAITNIVDKLVKDYVLYRIMNIHLNETPINQLGNLIKSFNKNCFNQKYTEKINRYHSKLDKLKPKKPAPNFTFPDQNGKRISLSDFNNKLVYIDIWNSHCSPCFKEFPILENLIEKFGGKEIVFIGISYDSNKNLWKKTIEKENLHGIQLFANGWNSQFGKDYLVYSNPRFILIDRNGNFINAKARRPSENIEEILNNHMIQ